MSVSHGGQRTVRFKQQLSHGTGYDAALIMASGHEPGRSEGPALPAWRVCAFYSLAEDTGEVHHPIVGHHAGTSLPVPVPVDPKPLAERAMTRLFHRFKKTVTQSLEFLTPVV